MRRRSSHALRRARELAEVTVADAVLVVLGDALEHEHPCLHDLGENDPPTLLAARRLAEAVTRLRTELRRYRIAVLRPTSNTCRNF